MSRNLKPTPRVWPQLWRCQRCKGVRTWGLWLRRSLVSYEWDYPSAMLNCGHCQKVTQHKPLHRTREGVWWVTWSALSPKEKAKQ